MPLGHTKKGFSVQNARKAILWIVSAAILMFAFPAYDLLSGKYRERQRELIRVQAIQKTHQLLAELDTLSKNDTKQLLEEGALELVRHSNKNKVYIGDRAVQVQLELQPAVALALLSAEAQYWAEKYKTRDSDCKVDDFGCMPVIKLTYQAVVMSGQPFENYGLSQKELEGRYAVLAENWNKMAEESQKKNPASIPLSPILFRFPTYQITVEGKPLAVYSGGLTEMAQLVIDVAKKMIAESQK